MKFLVRNQETAKELHGPSPCRRHPPTGRRRAAAAAPARARPCPRSASAPAAAGPATESESVKIRGAGGGGSHRGARQFESALMLYHAECLIRVEEVPCRRLYPKILVVDGPCTAAWRHGATPPASTARNVSSQKQTKNTQRSLIPRCAPHCEPALPAGSAGSRCGAQLAVRARGVAHSWQCGLAVWGTVWDDVHTTVHTTDRCGGF